MTDDAGGEADDDAAAAEGVDGRATDGGEGATEEVVSASPDGEAPTDESAGDDDVTTDESAGDEDVTADGPADAGSAATDDRVSGGVPGPNVGADAGEDVPGDVPDDVAKYDRFQKMERAEYDRVNEFLRDRTYVTAREWAIARLCADFRTETGVEMTKIGENLPRLVPFMTDTYTPQAVNQARASFEEKVRKAGATFLYGAMSGFFTAEDLDDVMYESTEVAKFLLEVEGADLAVEEELAAEDKISSVMRDVREASAEVRGEEVKCPECGHVHEP